MTAKTENESHRADVKDGIFLLSHSLNAQFRFYEMFKEKSFSNSHLTMSCSYDQCPTGTRTRLATGWLITDPIQS